jgi:uncharacterized protein YdbL (DUF1318 family)
MAEQILWRSKMSFLRAQLFLAILPCLFISCAGGPGLSQNKANVSDEQVQAIAAQVEEAVLYTKPVMPAEAADYNIDEKTGKVTGEFQPIEVIISLQEIEERVPALADLGGDIEPILSAVRGRILRRPAIYELEQNGCMGENNRGYAENIKGEACSGDRGERDRVAYMVLLENRDRRLIYDQLVQVLGLRNSDIGRIQKIFAQQIYQKAWAGTPLETARGRWERK